MGRSRTPPPLHPMSPMGVAPGRYDGIGSSNGSTGSSGSSRSHAVVDRLEESWPQRKKRSSPLEEVGGRLRQFDRKKAEPPVGFGDTARMKRTQLPVGFGGSNNKNSHSHNHKAAGGRRHGRSSGSGSGSGSSSSGGSLTSLASIPNITKKSPTSGTMVFEDMAEYTVLNTSVGQ